MKRALDNLLEFGVDGPAIDSTASSGNLDYDTALCGSLSADASRVLDLILSRWYFGHVFVSCSKSCCRVYLGALEGVAANTLPKEGLETRDISPLNPYCSMMIFRRKRRRVH